MTLLCRLKGVKMLEENELEVLKLYPSSKICDEWKQCVYEADIESRDLHCNGRISSGCYCATAPTPYYAPNGLPYRYNPESNTFEEIGSE